jgi:hypothetical protein
MLPPHECHAFRSQTIDHRTRAPEVKEIELTPWPIQLPVMVEQLEPPRHLPRRSVHQSENLRGTQKFPPSHLPDDSPIAYGQRYWSDVFPLPPEARQPSPCSLHSLILSQLMIVRADHFIPRTSPVLLNPEIPEEMKRRSHKKCSALSIL